MSFISKALMRMARGVLDSVLSGLTQQLNVVQDAAMAPMRVMIQQVTNGIWIGEGANAFVNEVSNLMMPGVGQVMDHITFMSTSLTKSREIIEQADESVQNMVTSRLTDQFSFF